MIRTVLVALFAYAMGHTAGSSSNEPHRIAEVPSTQEASGATYADDDIVDVANKVITYRDLAEKVESQHRMQESCVLLLSGTPAPCHSSE